MQEDIDELRLPVETDITVKMDQQIKGVDVERQIKRIKLLGIDIGQWLAWNTPIAAVLSLISVFIIIIFMEEFGPYRPKFLTLSIVTVVMIPINFIIFILAAWLQATIINFLLRFFPGGLDCYVEEKDESIPVRYQEKALSISQRGKGVKIFVQTFTILLLLVFSGYAIHDIGRAITGYRGTQLQIPLILIYWAIVVAVVFFGVQSIMRFVIRFSFPSDKDGGAEEDSHGLKDDQGHTDKVEVINCPSCGLLNKKSESKCFRCGRELQ